MAIMPTAEVSVDLEIKGEIKRLALLPGDVIVLRVLDRIPSAIMERLREHLLGVFPGHKVLVIDGGSELSIVSKDEAN